MATEVVPIGPAFILQPNVVYALPAYQVNIYTDSAATLETSNSFNFSTKVPSVFTNGIATVGGLFVRNTGATPQIVTLTRD